MSDGSSMASKMPDDHISSLCSKLAESSLTDGSMSIDDIEKTVMHDVSAEGQEDVNLDIKENEQIYEGNKDLEIKIKLSDLKKVGALGQGASGYVEKCFHKPTKTRIALKMIPLDSNETVKKHLLIELKTLHECDTDYVVKSYGAFLKDGFVHVALEYMDAGSLDTILKKVKTIPEDILGLMCIPMLKGLQYLNKEKKIIHRDIKPANILVNRKGQVKIADFGVSGKIDRTMDCLTSWVGTMTHMSPERLKGDPYHSNTDIWSLGLVMVESALGKYPFPLNPELEEIGFWEIMTTIE